MKVKIKTLSPLHIGGKEGIISPLDYVVFNERCYVINEDRLSLELYELGELDSFVDYVKRIGRRVEIEKFLRSRKLLKTDFLEKVSSYFSKSGVKIYGGLRPFIRDAFSQPYIPGSSIKGALRTSIMYVILKRLDDSSRRHLLNDFVQRRIKEYKKDPRGQKGYRWFQERFKKWFAKRLDEEIFQNFILRKGQRRYDAHSDILRYLKVSDSTSLKKESLVMEEIKIYSTQSSENFKRWSIFAECVPSGIEFTFELKIDTNILDDFAKNNSRTAFGMDFGEIYSVLSDPLIAVQERISDLLQEEKLFFSHNPNLREALEFKDNEPNFRLGWGEGLLGTSITLLLPLKIRQELRNILFKDCGDTPAPKSRKIVVGGAKKSLGWCILRREG